MVKPSEAQGLNQRAGLVGGLRSHQYSDKRLTYAVGAHNVLARIAGILNEVTSRFLQFTNPGYGMQSLAWCAGEQKG